MRSFKRKRFDEAEEIANCDMGDSNTLPSIFSADLSKVFRKTQECRVFLKIKINLYNKSMRLLYCYFWLRGKLVENTSLSLLIVSPRSLHSRMKPL